MKYFLLADCSTNVADCCSDYGMAVYLNIIQNALKIIQVIVPIILIVMGTVQLIKLMTSPEDKGGKGKKSFLNKFVAATLVFLLPFIVNLIIGLMSDSFEIASCWENAKTIVETTINGDEEYKVIHSEKKHKVN